jgi:DNA-binding HxlR family transcriptional regulator
MHHKSSPTASSGQAVDQLSGAQQEEDHAERTILGLMLYSEHPGPWSTAELQREVGDPIAVGDALSRLHGAGLIHRHEQFSFPTRATTQAQQLEI